MMDGWAWVRGERMCLARAGASEGGVDGEYKGGPAGRGWMDVKISNKWREGGKCPLSPARTETVQRRIWDRKANSVQPKIFAAASHDSSGYSHMDRNPYSSPFHSPVHSGYHRPYMAPQGWRYSRSTHGCNYLAAVERKH
jgi:hypothetical protein